VEEKTLQISSERSQAVAINNLINQLINQFNCQKFLKIKIIFNDYLLVAV